MAVKVVLGDEDSLECQALRTFDALLDAIAQGRVALLHAPPGRVSTSGYNPSEWIRKHWVRPPRSHEILRLCLETFEKTYATMPESDLEIAIENEIVSDLKRMQEQPVVLENYRRFVVLDEAQANGGTLYKDGFEFVSAASFETEILPESNSSRNSDTWESWKNAIV